MDLRLYVSKRHDLKDHSPAYYIRFAVVDLDRSQSYPLNFVCMLPQSMGGDGKPSSVFSKVFGTDGLELAKSLLTKASKAEDDSEIKAEIEKRLKMLEPKPAVQVECRVCGSSFEPKSRGRLKAKVCQECIRKKDQR